MDIIPLKDNIRQVVIKVKNETIYLPVAFVALQKIVILMNQLNVCKGDGVKIEYHLSSKKINDKYYTSAIIDKLVVTQKPQSLVLVDMETGEYL